MPKQQLIRYEAQSIGSPIWNATNAYQNLIQNHSFRDISNGEDAYFFKDSWQQLSKLQDGGTPTQWQERIENQGLTKVKDFWVDEALDFGFRVWKPKVWFMTWVPGQAGGHFY